MKLALLILVILVSVVGGAYAQDNTSSVCVVTFEDTNENGMRDAGEIPMPGISVHLAVDTDVILQTMITTEENRPFCFENLVNGEYHLYFAESQNHRATTQNNAPLSLSNSQRVRVEFGAVSVSPFQDTVADVTVEDDESLTTNNRLALAAFGSFVIMAFMMGVGMMIAAFLRR